VVLLFASIGAAQASPHETLLTSFGSHGGNYPLGGVVFDAAGNLYGTTGRGGRFNAGTVFKLTPPAGGHGAWRRTTLYTFNGTDGQAPRGTLVLDSAGNIYGTTAIGGANNMGTAYELSPPVSGNTAWQHTLLTSFDNSGNYPYAGMVFDKTGHLYGTTLGTSASHKNPPWTGSAVYELIPPAGGEAAWKRKIIQKLDSDTGYAPASALVIDGSGNLYGTTQGGGGVGGGAVFELSPPTKGNAPWTTTVLYVFEAQGGPYSALGTLVFDGAGNLFGTTYFGGEYTYGTVFELSPPPAGQTKWTPTLIWSFGLGINGQYPTEGNLVIGKSGQLYGLTYDGGPANFGVAFELIPPTSPGGSWSQRNLIGFTGPNGAAAMCYLTTDAKGLLYGVTDAGGTGYNSHSIGYGTVYRLRP
jgi:uncharacterized repeat protein (TIGR03803 family)